MENKKEITPEQMERNISHMSNRQLSNRLKRLTGLKHRRDLDKFSPAESAWAIVLSIVFQNTKPMGKMEAFLR